jgi:hypothetical protein
LYVDLAHFHVSSRPKAATRGPQQRPGVPRPKTIPYDLRFTNLLLQSIGFDRSAFAARPRGAGRQSKSKESSECSIHDEGLPELLPKVRNDEKS